MVLAGNHEVSFLSEIFELWTGPAENQLNTDSCDLFRNPAGQRKRFVPARLGSRTLPLVWTRKLIYEVPQCDNGGGTDKKHNITYTSDYCLPAQQSKAGRATTSMICCLR